MAGIAGVVEDGFAIALIQVRMFLRQNTGFAIAALRFASCPAFAGMTGRVGGAVEDRPLPSQG